MITKRKVNVKKGEKLVKHYRHRIVKMVALSENIKRGGGMKFTKMHGLGNDFIVVEHDAGLDFDYKSFALKICDRYEGIGADGLVIAMPSNIADIRMKIINSDGSEAEMCGNAIRCFAKYAYERSLVKSDSITVETPAGIIKPFIVTENGSVKAVRVNMGKPGLNRSDVPMIGDDGAVLNERLQVQGETYFISSLLMGVPHTVVHVEDINKAPVTTIGPAIEKHHLFPKRTNVNFVEIINDSEIKVRTWERGAGATLACGTGSCASVVASHLMGKTKRTVTVHLKLGSLHIEWQDDGNVFMTGPATEVFEGNITV